LSQSLETLSDNLTPQIHLVIRISARCRATTFSFFTGHVSLACKIQLRTQLL